MCGWVTLKFLLLPGPWSDTIARPPKDSLEAFSDVFLDEGLLRMLLTLLLLGRFLAVLTAVTWSRERSYGLSECLCFDFCLERPQLASLFNNARSVGLIQSGIRMVVQL